MRRAIREILRIPDIGAILAGYEEMPGRGRAVVISIIVLVLMLPGIIGIVIALT